MALTATHQAGQDTSPAGHGTRCALILHPILNLVKISACRLILILLPYQPILQGHMQALKNQTFGQFITNPMNSFGINPKYKWAELQLGTQYLKYSDLSTGDIGVFGIGFDLRPKTFLFKFFTGISQQGINYVAGPPTVAGAYKRKNWMAQIGTEKEGKYLFALNVAKGKDVPTSAAPPPLTIRPQEGVVISLVSDLYVEKGFYFKAEGAQSTFTKDVATPLSPVLKSLKPFIEAHTSTINRLCCTGCGWKKIKEF